jgi:hypothetical protein
LDKLCCSCHGNKEGGFKKHFGFLSSNFMKLQPLKAQLHMAYDIPTRLHKVYLDFFNFYIGGHFENFKNKEHNFE